MFPLEQTVLPTTVIPLHIFEPRYRTLAAEVTALDEPEFGIVGIERGREVGGDDVRADVAVVARIIEHEEFPDGRWAIAALATRRIRVDEWLPDDPYPRASVTDWPDDDASQPLERFSPTARTGLGESLDRICAAVERLRPGHTVPAPMLSDDPARAIWEAAVFAQLSSYDAMSLLRTPDATARLAAADEIIRERAEILEALAEQGG